MVTNSPWYAGDHYDEQLHGKPEQYAPSAARTMGIVVALAGSGIIIGLCLIIRAVFT